MRANVPNDELVRETMDSLGPRVKDFTLDDLAAWIRQLQELCNSKDSALAPTSYRTDIIGSCLTTFQASGSKLTTAAQTVKLQTKTVKGYRLLPELQIEKVNSQKKNARGEAKLRLNVERGSLLVLLTITDLDGATRTLRAVKEDDNDLIPIRHPATNIAVTVVPFTPEELLKRLHHVEAKIKEQRERQAAASQHDFEPASAPPRAGRVKPLSETELCKRVATIMKEMRAIQEQLPTAKPAEKKRLFQELGSRRAERAELTDLMLRIAGAGGGLGAPMEELFALFEQATQKNPKCTRFLIFRAADALIEYEEIREKLESTLSQTKKKRLSKLLARKEIEFGGAMDEIAAIADRSEDENGVEPGDGEDLNDGSSRMKYAWVAVLVSVVVLTVLYMYLY